MWRLGMKQPSKDGFKYVEHDDCIPYNPMDARVKNSTGTDSRKQDVCRIVQEKNEASLVHKGLGGNRHDLPEEYEGAEVLHRRRR